MSILLNQSFIPTELGAINPNTTVLDWLRGNQLVGTNVSQCHPHPIRIYSVFDCIFDFIIIVLSTP